jgi:hypothetical protein
MQRPMIAIHSSVEDFLVHRVLPKKSIVVGSGEQPCRISDIGNSSWSDNQSKRNEVDRSRK